MPSLNALLVNLARGKPSTLRLLRTTYFEISVWANTVRQNVDVLLEGAIDLFTLAADYSTLPYLFFSAVMN